MGLRLALSLTGVLSGLLYVLSLPKADLWWLAWVCLVPSLATLPALSRSTWHLLSAGLALGLVSAAGRTYWITETLQNYGGLPVPLALLTNGLLIVYMALYPAVFFIISARVLPRNSALFPLSCASLFVLLEWIQTWALTGFPWELLGYSQYLNRPLLQIVSLTGVYGLTFIVVLTNAALAQTLLYFTGRLRREFPIARALGLPGALLAAALLFGWWQLPVDPGTAWQQTRVGIVQGNVPQDIKWQPDRNQLTTSHYVEQTRELAAQDSADLIIFPETALPFWFKDPQRASEHELITALAIEIDTPLLVGSLGFDTELGHFYNRGFLMDAKGVTVDVVDKVHLVPFGEYLPLPWIFQYMEELTAQSGQFAPGVDGHKMLRIPGTEVPFGVFICYESIFPSIPRQLAAAGASFLVNTTNDAWFGTTAAPFQHLSMAVVRAVETGRPVVRVANTGISALITTDGRILRATGLFETATRVLSFHPRRHLTFYVRHGDWFLVVCALLLVGTLAADHIFGTSTQRRCSWA